MGGFELRRKIYRFIAFAALAAAVLFCAPAAWAAAAPGERGISADAGFEAPEESPEYGRAKELLQIAVMHGRDDREKIKEALFWLESGTAKNCPYAMALLGSYYLDGGFTERSRREAERDPEKGLALLRRAAAMDAPAAHIVLGRIYFNGGCGVARDAEAGLAHFDRAIAAGSRRAACIIAQSYERGYWLGQDYRRAREYYEKARSLGEEGLDDRIYNLEHLPDYFWGSYLSVKACAKEEVRPDVRYVGRSLRLSGLVASVRKEPGGGVAVILNLYENPAVREAECLFAPQEAARLAGCAESDSLAVQGKVTGFAGGANNADGARVLMEDCWPVRDYYR